MRLVKPDVWVVRHGQTEWSVTGRHTGRTDVPLTAVGEAEARSLASVLAAHAFAFVLTSPARRARDTARLAGFPDAEVVPDLLEFDYGDVEGLTTEEVRSRGPEWADWTVWNGSCPGGESCADVALRARRVLERVEAAPGDVLLFAHAHLLRILTAVALELAPEVGSRFLLDPANVSIIGTEHELRALRVWNRGT
jgi:broad specificity phosphatase PhoE